MTMPPATSTKKKVATNVGWSVAGQVLPLAFAIAVMPMLVRTLGVDRLGFLSLAWVLVGYASLFDFGISRAMTRVVARRLEQHDQAGAFHVGSVAMTFMVGLGAVAGIGLMAVAEPTVDSWLLVPQALRAEARNALFILAASMPLVLLTAAYRGYIEASQAFKPLSLIRIFMGLFTYVAPLLAALVSARLEVVIGAVVLMRVVANLAHAVVARRYCQFTYGFVVPDRATSRELFSLGGWMSVSNIVGPLLSYMDRIILGGLVTVELVAYYATPYDVISRTMAMPYALMGVLFPILAGKAGSGDSTRGTYTTSIRLIWITMFPVIFTAVVFAHPILTLWLGPKFAEHGALVLQVLALGVLTNSLAQAPANLIQGAGNPKWMALAHVLELPVFLFALWWMTAKFGIAGTAICAAARMAIDAVIMFSIASFRLHQPSLSGDWYAWMVVAPVALLASAFAVTSVQAGVALWSAGVLLFAFLAWHKGLHETDRNYFASLLMRRVGNKA